MLYLFAEADYGLILEYLKVCAHCRLNIVLQHLEEQRQLCLENQVLCELLTLLVPPQI